MPKLKLTHIELQAAVVKLFAFTGWSHLHVRRSVGRGKKWTTTTNVKGWPDLFAWNPRQPGRLLAIEVKVPPDSLSNEQAAVLAELAASGVECHVITEAELASLPGVLKPQKQSAARAGERATLASAKNSDALEEQP